MEVADFALPESVLIIYADYLRYLNPDTANASESSNRKWTKSFESKDTFVDCANEMSAFIQRKTGSLHLLEFRNTPNKAQPGHVTDTKCKPDFVAAFTPDWQHQAQVHAWPFIQFAGEIASRGKNNEEQRKQAVSYVHFLLLARPDLGVGHGLLVSDTHVVFFVGAPGKGVSHIDLSFKKDQDLIHQLMYAIIHHIYIPGQFKDETCKVNYNPRSQKCTYTFTIDTGKPGRPQLVNYSGFLATYASSPFGTRTHVFVNSDPVPPALPSGDSLRVVKDQYCPVDGRFNEPGILKHIHDDGPVPGVVELVHDEVIPTPVLGSGHSHRIKRRLGFKQMGSPFINISTPKLILETAFDILEVTRYLRFKRNVLHRDISIGNIMCTPDNDDEDLDARQSSVASTEDRQDEPVGELDISFIGYLLGNSVDPRKTRVLIIDFNRSKRLDGDGNAERELRDRTDTPLFIARAVENGGPYPPIPEDDFVLKAVPAAPPAYTLNHPQRIKLFDGVQKTLVDPTRVQVSRFWRHELYHDAESVFWLILYWSMCAKPSKPSSSEVELIPRDIWTYLTTGKTSRHGLIRMLLDVSLSSITHSDFEPITALLKKLASIIVFDQQYLPKGDRRNRVEYVHEAFQRILLQFIIDNQAEGFMNLTIEQAGRGVEKPMPTPSLSISKAQYRLGLPPSKKGSKRASPTPEDEQDEMVTHAESLNSGRSKRARRGSGNPQFEPFA